MSKFDSIRFYHDDEVSAIIQSIEQHPMVKSLIDFTFPNITNDQFHELLHGINSIKDFQSKIIYHTLQRVLANSSEGISSTGFEKIDPDTSYLYISNHRDILLDTSFLNVLLLEKGKVMTASAMGDNLVKKKLFLDLAKLNRNFMVKRNLPPRELLESSKNLSEYIYHLLTDENRSVWIAQREGRTKDGNDATHPGVLKMIGMACNEASMIDYLKKLRIVPVTISYEYDPTDKLKMPQLMAKMSDETYIKEKNEDFINLMSGVVGQKKRIHLHIGDVLDTELDVIQAETTNVNKQIQLIAKAIDDQIIANYKLWPTNYIAYDLLNNTNTFEKEYTDKEKQLFLRRLELKVDKNNEAMVDTFLEMYANPVVNKLKLQNA
ncbi:1-acyl-sn-glycerol-3-phosphate acyltransferase [Flavobacterium sp. xlx-214]|uniref:1-acyl-sn-glycerol-3-phosphate acyltransferase n=1 Tax=unclassified Flavobacterium TaxID=196869 RepID=UPI0013D3F349|nr:MULTISPECIES: 1-acyl-sn-glycerol-3-phosphate acyltransferase [unclassified Flavobacterium]MBA5792199.1 1-acyl-sn-glycerol-3-phosphate acyltransferase [Flavobacterium sp. xlx-221]QMI84442.1 1-acyl-sn-glycerol-3-phosphate acyltransferase [Flavobacterium sp. xlx-214]